MPTSSCRAPRAGFGQTPLGKAGVAPAAPCCCWAPCATSSTTPTLQPRHASWPCSSFPVRPEAFPPWCSPCLLLELLMILVAAILPLSIAYTFLRALAALCHIPRALRAAWAEVMLLLAHVMPRILTPAVRAPGVGSSQLGHEIEGVISNNILISISQVRCRLSCKKVSKASSTELRMLQGYNTDGCWVFLLFFFNLLYFWLLLWEHCLFVFV